MHIAGSDLALHRTSPNGGEYTAEWNTTGIDPTRQATRQQLPITLQVQGSLLFFQSKKNHSYPTEKIFFASIFIEMHCMKWNKILKIFAFTNISKGFCL